MFRNLWYIFDEGCFGICFGAALRLHNMVTKQEELCMKIRPVTGMALVVLCLAAILFLSGCPDMMSTSWGLYR